MNIPLLNAIKQVPKYAKFLKELCTNKRKLKGDERITMGRNVSALIQPNMPEKCKDPGMFSVPCTIGNSTFQNALLDLGASINVMPASIHKSLNLGPLQPSRVIITLANRSIAHPIGVIEDCIGQSGQADISSRFLHPRHGRGIFSTQSYLDPWEAISENSKNKN